MDSQISIANHPIPQNTQNVPSKFVQINDSLEVVKRKKAVASGEIQQIILKKSPRQRLQIPEDRFPQIRYTAVSNYCQICCKQRVLKMAYFCCRDHRYCTPCIEELIKEKMNNFQTIKCPHQSCIVEFNQQSPYFNKMSETNKVKLKQLIKTKKLLEDPKSRHCQKQGCQGLLIIQPKSVYCGLCSQKYCFKCLEMYKAQKCDCLAARKIQKKHGFRRCPSCKMVVQKTQGCSHMTCYCKYEFCYICSQPYRNHQGGHQCKIKQVENLPFLLQMQANIFNPSSTYNTVINAGSLLRCFKPEIQRGVCRNCVYLSFFTLLLYPLFTVAVSLLMLLLPILMMIVFIVIMLPIFLIAIPLQEICKLKLSVSTCLGNYLPTCLVRCLVLPLYPIYVLAGIVAYLPKQFSSLWHDLSSVLASIPTTIGFCLLLPCLILVNDEDQQN